jgi:hypothetical protein
VTSADTLNWTWRIEAGERETLDVPIFLGDGTTPKDVSGYTVDAVIKTEAGGSLLYAFPTEHISIDESVVTLLIPAPISAAWVWSVGWWRLVITAPSPDPLDPESDRVVQGAFIVDPG